MCPIYNYILKRKILENLWLQPQQFTYNKGHTNDQSHLSPYSAMLRWQMPTMSHAAENFPHCQNTEHFVVNLRGCVVEWYPWVNWWTYCNTNLHKLKNVKIMKLTWNILKLLWFQHHREPFPLKPWGVKHFLRCVVK